MADPGKSDPARSPALPRREFKSLALLALLACAVGNVWLRGPLFGLLPYVLFTGPPALLAVYVLHRVRLPRRVAAPVAVAVAITLSWFMAAPPGTARIFTDYLETSVPSTMCDLRRWNDNWTRDPAYYLRFHTDAATIAHFVADTCISPVQFTPLTPPEYHIHAPPRMLLPVPAWWNPAELQHPQLWHGPRGGCGVELWYDEDSGLAYLSVSTT